MRKLFSFLALALICAGLASAQGNPVTNGQSILTHVGGVFVSKNYSYWNMVIDNPTQVVSASPATFTLRQGSYTLPDGRVQTPFVNEIVTIGAGSVQENVTLTAVSGCYANAPYDSCTISGNTSNSHGKGELVVSSSQGIQEAVNDAASQGGDSVYWEVDCGNVTLSTSSATTTTACLVPKTFTTLGASLYVTTAITTSTTTSLGITSHTTTFMNACTSVTLASSCGQFVPAPTALAGGTGYGDLIITSSTTAGAGAVHPKVWGYIGVQSSF